MNPILPHSLNTKKSNVIQLCSILLLFFVYYVFQQKNGLLSIFSRAILKIQEKMSILFLAVWQHNKRLLGLFNTNVKILGTNIFQFNFKILNTNTYFSKGVIFPLTFVAYPTVRNLEKDHDTWQYLLFHYQIQV